MACRFFIKLNFGKVLEIWEICGIILGREEKVNGKFKGSL